MISEKTIGGAGQKYPLNGLLTFQDDLSKPVPGVVMVHGSGPGNMDEKVLKLPPFKDLAEGLAQHGIASLRYDKRTSAHGRRLAKTDLTVKEETIDDALPANRGHTVFSLYPGLNHLFVKAMYKDILNAAREYRVERHIKEDVISDIADLICADSAD